MKIAYLILAHNNYTHLNRLLRALSGPNSDIFLHIDSKSPRPEISSEIEVTFVKRVKAEWGRFSLVQATLHLLREAMEKSDAGYFCLLSGADYPVRPQKELLQKLKREGGEYINLTRVPGPGKPISRFDRHYLQNFDRKSRGLKSLVFLLLEKALYKVGVRRKVPFKVFAGSQWFTISRECAAYILESAESQTDLVGFFKKTLVPDESFFHTLIGNSPFYEKVQHSLTYSSWAGGASPKMMTKDKIHEILSTSSITDSYGEFTPFFARKFDNSSGEVVEAIEVHWR